MSRRGGRPAKVREKGDNSKMGLKEHPLHSEVLPGLRFFEIKSNTSEKQCSINHSCPVAIKGSIEENSGFAESNFVFGKRTVAFGVLRCCKDLTPNSYMHIHIFQKVRNKGTI